MILIETRVKESKVKRVREQINLYDKYLDNFNWHDNGRLQITWNDTKVDVHCVHSIDQAIHCGIYDKFGVFKFWLTAVYSHNHLDQRRILQKTIERLKPITMGPWCVMGDFNNVMAAQDRIGGRLVKEVEYCDLHEMMARTVLSEMESI